jgi:hypothetical protein
MILNKKYNFLYVHIQKTAGTSISYRLFELDNTVLLNYGHSFIDSVDYSTYNKFYKFCFVRNPFDRLVSWYNMMLHKGVGNDFSKYLLTNSKNFSEFINLTKIIYETNKLEWDGKNPYPKSIGFNQLDYVSDNKGNVLVDFIGRFENLNEDYDKIIEKIGVKNLPLPHLNKFEYKDYRTYYTDKDIEKVYKIYEKDIKYFGYEF